MKLSTDQKVALMLELAKPGYKTNKIWERYNEIVTMMEGERRVQTEKDDDRSPGTELSNAIDKWLKIK